MTKRSSSETIPPRTLTYRSCGPSSALSLTAWRKEGHSASPEDIHTAVHHTAAASQSGWDELHAVVSLQLLHDSHNRLLPHRRLHRGMCSADKRRWRCYSGGPAEIQRTPRCAWP
ncbi:hypothetical protein MHYP_G00062420 [Metynnis hypsauchen]